MKKVKIFIATHKKYKMPEQKVYVPIHVGRANKNDIGYIGDNIGCNISNKNSSFCELTGLYWAWKNGDYDYLGLAHYRRHFSNKSFLYRIFNDKFNCILDEDELYKLVSKYDIILPKKRNYYIEDLYTHYSHTHYAEHLDKTRDIIKEYFNDYLDDFDRVMKRKSAHMFNMFIMRRELANRYCEWLFFILSELEKRIDISNYDAFQSRLYGRVSELLLDVWIEHNKFKYKEIPYIHMEKINWLKKGSSFLYSKITGDRLKGSF